MQAKGLADLFETARLALTEAAARSGKRGGADSDSEKPTVWSDDQFQSKLDALSDRVKSFQDKRAQGRVPSAGSHKDINGSKSSNGVAIGRPSNQKARLKREEMRIRVSPEHTPRPSGPDFTHRDLRARSTPIRSASRAQVTIKSGDTPTRRDTHSRAARFVLTVGADLGPEEL